MINPRLEARHASIGSNSTLLCSSAILSSHKWNGFVRLPDVARYKAQDTRPDARALLLFYERQYPVRTGNRHSMRMSLPRRDDITRSRRHNAESEPEGGPKAAFW